jgi:hypothetical protein
MSVRDWLIKLNQNENSEFRACVFSLPFSSLSMDTGSTNPGSLARGVVSKIG